jgi:hypothetical protein
MNGHFHRMLESFAGLLVLRGAAILLFAIATFPVMAAQAQTFTVLHSFTGGGDGGSPSSGLAINAGGTLYGTTIYIVHGYGLVFELKRHGSSWFETPLYSFTGGNDGSQPYTTPLLAPDGTLYGANYGQFAECCGSVFHLQPSPNAPRSVLTPWDITVLHHFTGGDDGAYPNGDLARDVSGNIYGETQSDGPGGNGIVYELTPTGDGWNETILYAAQGGNDGGYPRGNVVLDPAGNVYGVFWQDGPYGYGAIYEVSPSGSGWIESTVYGFTGGDDGGSPFGGLVRDQAGNIYGTTTIGTNGGTVFELSPSRSGWVFNVLYSFGSRANVGGSLKLDPSGNLYGANCSGGYLGQGAVFKLTPQGHGNWSYTSLHDFTDGDDGACPQGVVLDSSGNVYGTDVTGGASGFGVAFEIMP